MEKREREKKKDLSPTREKVVVSLEKGVVVVGGLSRAAKKKSSSFLVRNTSTTFLVPPCSWKTETERRERDAGGKKKNHPRPRFANRDPRRRRKLLPCRLVRMLRIAIRILVKGNPVKFFSMRTRNLPNLSGICNSKYSSRTVSAKGDRGGWW